MMIRVTSIICQGFSWFQLIGMAVFLRGAKRVLFCRPGLFPQAPLWKRRLIKAILHRLSPRTVIEESTIEEVVNDIWRLNANGPQQVASLSVQLEESPIVATARRIFRDPDIIKYYQATLARELPVQTFCFRVGRRMENQGEKVTVLPLTPDTGHLGSEVRHFVESHPIPRPFCLVNRLRLLFSNFKSFLFLLALPAGLMFQHLRHGFVSGARPKFRLIMPIVWGFREPDNLMDGLKRSVADDYLYGQALKPGDIVHTFGDWPIPSAERNRYLKIMRERGFSARDKRLYRVTPAWLKEGFRLTLLLLKEWRWIFDRSVLHHLLLKASPKAYYYYLCKQLELENVDYTVELLRNDYNPAHVIATILNRRHGKRTVAVQHTASPFDAPQLAFVHVDRYIIYGELYVRLFSPFWDGLTLDRIGREILDSVVQLSLDRAERERIRQRTESLYGKARWTVVVLFPGGAEICLRRQWDEIYEGLRLLSRERLDMKVFLRFRYPEQLKTMNHLQRFAEFPAQDPRFVMDHTHFTTQELLVISDLAIVPQASFTMNEASAAGLWAFPFEYTGAGGLYFADYGKDILLKTAEDVVRAFKGLQNGFEGFDCRWKDLRKDLNYHADGGNSRRLQEVIVGLN